MAHLFKEARECGCGYVTQHRGAWCKHRKTCKHVAAQKHEERRDQEMEDLVKQQLATKDEQLAAKDAQLATKDEQLTKAYEQLAAKDRLIDQLVSASKKPRAAPARKSLPEPKRRRIAAAQNWKCANPDGMCLLKGDLEEYDVDHRTSLARGGDDDLLNMQALCPACHRRKTERDNRLLAEEGRAIEGDDS